MVRWSVRKYKVRCDVFFERESYEMNVMRMLRDLVEHESGWDNIFMTSYDDFPSFRDHVMWMVDQRSYYHDMWDEAAAV